MFSRLCKMLKEIFDVAEKNHTSSGKFSISSVGGCLRKKYLEMRGLYKEEFDSKSLRAFELGDLFHMQAVKELIEKGEKLDLRVVSCEVNIPMQERISGRADLIISDSKTGELFVVDIKSCGDYTLNEVKKGKINENYINQLQLYLHFFKLKRGFILFYGKHKGEVVEVEVKYDEKKCEELLITINNFLINNIDKGIEPAKCDNSGMFKCNCCY